MPLLRGAWPHTHQERHPTRPKQTTGPTKGSACSPTSFQRKGTHAAYQQRGIRPGAAVRRQERVLQPAGHISGAHLLKLTGNPRTARLREVLGENLGGLVVDWHRETLGYGRDITDHAGKPTTDPFAEDVLAVPLSGDVGSLVGEFLADNGIAAPTRAEVRQFAADYLIRRWRRHRP